MISRGAVLLWTISSLLVASIPPAQSQVEELPSAPSATVQQKKNAPPKPVPQASQPAQPVAAAPAQTPATPSNIPAEVPAARAASGPANQRAEEDETTTTIRVPVNEVNVVFTVTDRHGRYIKDLKKDDFRVMDDNRPAEQIRSFHAEADLPLQVGLLIDASNSIRDRFKFEQESAVEFLNQTVRHNYDKAFVVGFDVTPEVTQDFTDDSESLSRGVRALRPGGGTAMYDALYFACRDKLMKSTHTGPVRKAIILLSDGDDNLSHVTREEAIEMAQRAEVIVYTISTNVTGSASKSDKILERIADATGGRPFFPFQLTDVANAFGQIQDELRSQYALSYKPVDFRADGRYHSIEILAKNQKGLRVRSRKGYFAPNQ